MMPNEIKKTGDTIEWHPRMMKIKCSLLLRQVWRHFLNRVYTSADQAYLLSVYQEDVFLNN